MLADNQKEGFGHLHQYDMPARSLSQDPAKPTGPDLFFTSGQPTR